MAVYEYNTTNISWSSTDNWANEIDGNDNISVSGSTGAVTITDDVTGIGEVTDSRLLPTDLQIPVQFIPANNSTIPATTPIGSLTIKLVMEGSVGPPFPTTLSINSPYH